ncbi:MAG: DNA polymerase III subunit beta [Peptococcaceae bacterium]|nr:DNA polymerase III subunit beta [Peptococcaceae bacterium]
MKFTAIKENLTTGLGVVQRALSAKAMQPILSGIYLSAKNGHLTMVATDTIENTGLRIQCTVPVDVIEEGDTVVSGKSFRDFVMRLPDTNLMFENISYNGQDKMTIHYDQNDTEMNGWPGYDFPKPPKMDILHCMSISQTTLADLVRQTSFAARKEDLRPIFTGLLFEVNGNDLTVVGTDSFRLAMMQDKVNNESGGDYHVVIPVRALQEVIAIAEEDAIIHMSITKNQILFECGNVQITSQLIKGEFPPYRAALPKSHTTHFDIERTALRQSIERATLFGRDRDGTSVIRMHVESGRMTIRTASERGQVNEEIGIYMEGDEVNILFNAAFLADALSKMHYDALDVEMSGDLGPCVFKPKNDERYLYLLLPLRQ